MSYLYPPFPTIPTIPTQLPPTPLAIAFVNNTSYTLTTNDDLIMCYQTCTIYLPIAGSVKIKRYEIKLWIAGSIVTIVPTSPEGIDNATSAVISAPFENRTVIPWPTIGWQSV